MSNYGRNSSRKHSKVYFYIYREFFVVGCTKWMTKLISFYFLLNFKSLNSFESKIQETTLGKTTETCWSKSSCQNENLNWQVQIKFLNLFLYSHKCGHRNVLSKRQVWMSIFHIINFKKKNPPLLLPRDIKLYR